MKKEAWNAVSHTVATTRQNDRVKQQQVYRLIEALKKTDDVMFKKLIDMGVSPDTPLYLEGDISSPMAKDLFLDVPAATTLKMDFVTPLGFFALSDDVGPMQKLVKSGADLSFPGFHGRDPLWLSMIASAPNAWDFIKSYFVSTGQDIPWRARTSNGKRTTRLMDAVLHRNLDAVRDIIGHVKVDDTDFSGKTALHYNFLQEPYTEIDAQIGRLLVSYGAPVEAEDHDGVAPAALALAPEQKVLIDAAVLSKMTQEAFDRAQSQRTKIDHDNIVKPTDPSDPGFPQIQRPVRFKKPLM